MSDMVLPNNSGMPFMTLNGLIETQVLLNNIELNSLNVSELTLEN